MESTFEDIKNVIVGTGKKIADGIYKKTIYHTGNDLFFGYFKIDDSGEPVFVRDKIIDIVYNETDDKLKWDFDNEGIFEYMRFDYYSHFDSGWSNNDIPLYEYKFFNCQKDIDEYAEYYKLAFKDDYKSRLEFLRKKYLNQSNYANMQMESLQSKIDYCNQMEKTLIEKIQKIS